MFDYLSKIRVPASPPLGRVFKIHVFFGIDNGHDQWITPLGVR